MIISSAKRIYDEEWGDDRNVMIYINHSLSLARLKSTLASVWSFGIYNLNYLLFETEKNRKKQNEITVIKLRRNYILKTAIIIH